VRLFLRVDLRSQPAEGVSPPGLPATGGRGRGAEGRDVNADAASKGARRRARVARARPREAEGSQEAGEGMLRARPARASSRGAPPGKHLDLPRRVNLSFAHDTESASTSRIHTRRGSATSTSRSTGWYGNTSRSGTTSRLSQPPRSRTSWSGSITAPERRLVTRRRMRSISNNHCLHLQLESASPYSRPDFTNPTAHSQLSGYYWEMLNLAACVSQQGA